MLCDLNDSEADTVDPVITSKLPKFTSPNVPTCSVCTLCIICRHGKHVSPNIDCTSQEKNNVAHTEINTRNDVSDLCKWLLCVGIALHIIGSHFSASNSSPWFKSKGLKIVCLNINRVLGKLEQVKLSLEEQKPDIFGLCETFLNDKVDDRLLQYTGYITQRRDRVDKAGGGLFFYIRDDLAYKRRTDLEDQNIEIIWLEILYPSSKKCSC